MSRLFAVSFLFFIIDQGTKFFAQSLFSNEGFFLFSPFFELTFILNKTFVSFSFSQLFFSTVSAAFLIVCVALYYFIKRISVTVPTAYFFGTSLLIAGVGGNMLDRIRLGGVIDWINLVGIGIFNIADICIAVGAILSGWYFFKLNQKNVTLKIMSNK